ncbi:MAG TPA: PAS domain S-box protein [Phycisphaerae bacterium]|nr:PAS domain S-box protein [Phycisphaerae bacterium]HNU44389.1 PAS domain S-box protein [Phycisphaerae bacterium]
MSAEVAQALVALCHRAVITADPRGRIRSWNAAAQQMFGYRADEVVGRAVTILVPPRLRRRHRAAFKARLAQVASFPFASTVETEGLHREGRPVPVEALVMGLLHEGKPLLAAIIHDASRQRQVVEQLNEALQRTQFHVERMPLAHIVWDTDFRVVDWNPAAARIFGYTQAEAIGRHAYGLIVPTDAMSVVDPVWGQLMHGDASSHSLNDNVRKDGSRLKCEWFNTPLRDSQGRIRGVASMAMDVTERTAVETQLRDAQKMESLGVLASGLAHDFNSLLTVVIANTALLRSVKALPPRAREYLDLIEQASFRASGLIEHLMVYARTGRHNPQPTNLSKVVRGIVPFVQRSLGPDHLIRTRLAGRLPLVLADHSQLEQILLNLCMNAMQASELGGTIEVSTGVTALTPSLLRHCTPADVPPGRYVELTVSDTGCGMTKDVVARVFDPFFTTRPQGHGLGMAAVLGILRQHRGAAWVESEPQRGTRVHIYIPVPPKASGKSRTRRHSGPESRFGV